MSDRGEDQKTEMGATNPNEGIPNWGTLKRSESSGSGQGPTELRDNLEGEKASGNAQKRQEKVMERVYNRSRLRMAWQQVKGNAGAAGIDRMTVEDFEGRQEELLSLIEEKLEAGTYRFKPARRVEIPKPGTDSRRKLGIPVVMDRVVSQSMNLTLGEIFEPGFTSSNYGFRRGKSQHRAIGHVRQAVEEGHRWCVSIDLRSFFDEIPHSLIFRLIKRKMNDDRMITLIARALKAGVMEGGKYIKATKGCPQGSSVSPILSNIVLNELDQELERRGHRYCRWADDFLILLKSERAAKRVMENITRYLEEKLGLPVNKEKSLTGTIQNIEFLGFQIQKGKIRISAKSQARFKEKVRELTRRNNPLSMYEIIRKLNEYLMGWVAYYRVQEFRCLLGDMDRFVRNRLRSMQLKKWKTPQKFRRILVKAGYRLWSNKVGWVRMDRWASIKRKEVKFVLNANWFRRQGLVFLDSYTQRGLELAFSH
jgi:RNA-directed DNA polymerase